MTTTYNIKDTARGYDSRGVTDWGLASRHLDTLVNVTLGSRFQSASRGEMVHITVPLWDGVKDFTVKMADIVWVVVDDPPPTLPIATIYPPGASIIRLVQPDGRIAVGRNRETVTYDITFE